MVLREEERRRFTANSKFEKLSGKAHSLLFFMVNDRTCLSLSCPLYFEYLCLACTIPFTSASNERAFSKLKLIKDRLRSTMVDSRMCSLIIMSSNKDICDSFDTQKDLVPAWHRKGSDSGKVRRIDIPIILEK